VVTGGHAEGPGSDAVSWPRIEPGLPDAQSGLSGQAWGPVFIHSGVTSPVSPRPDSTAEPEPAVDAKTGETPGGGHGAAVRPASVALVLGALGVVFGDIGTSPLSALQTVFSLDQGEVKPTPDDVYGVISLVFWSVTLIVSVKYVLVVMRADNDGEGGVMALAALGRRLMSSTSKRTRVCIALGVLGASLFYGDSVITPAISVLSAVEGITVTDPGLAPFVVPIAATILTGLFAAQRWGNGRVGRLFGPVMLLWFLALAVAGVAHVVQDPVHQGPVADLRVRVRRLAPVRRLRGPRCGRPVDHRCRGPVCRHGPLREAGHQPGMVLGGLPRAGAQLPRPGRG